jgi:two-component system, OmpR family, phosphate regulon sensor histidine kinase PhoR
MEKAKPTYDELVSENTELRFQLEEANDTIEAIRTGQVDALIVQGDNGHQLYTLKTADQTYRMFIEKMNEGAVTLNREGIILYSNFRFAEMVNMPLEKVIGIRFDTFILKEAREEFYKLIENGWERECKEEVLLVHNKRYTPCLLSCNTLELDEGIALSLILTDLSIQKEAERQLKINNEQLIIAQNATEKLNDELEDTVRSRTADLLLSREHFKLLANNIPQMTWTNLPDGTVNFYNQQWYNYTGLSYEDTQQPTWRATIIHPDDLQPTVDRYNAAIKSGAIFEMENRYRRYDGTYRWHLNRAVPLLDDKGEIVFWVGTATDIEDQKQEMERKDEFIGVASHELKTPLTSLKGYLQLISYKKGELSPAVKQYIDKAIVALNKLQNLVNDLLDVSKINAGRLEYSVADINLTELLRSCIDSAKHVFPSFEFVNDLEGEFIVSGNAERLEQVVMNLINNAVKYSPINRTVIIKASQNDNHVRVYVTDFGIGLTDKQQERIFERFYRVEDKKYMSSGLGMGLYISKEIINHHNGKIGVQSELGQGSTFYFDLPLVNN